RSRAGARLPSFPTRRSSDLSALHLVLSGDPGLFAIVRLSLLVSLSAVLFAGLIGVPFGALIALTRFRAREIVIVVLNALMGLPPDRKSTRLNSSHCPISSAL